MIPPRRKWRSLQSLILALDRSFPVIYPLTAPVIASTPNTVYPRSTITGDGVCEGALSPPSLGPAAATDHDALVAPYLRSIRLPRLYIFVTPQVSIANYNLYNLHPTSTTFTKLGNHFATALNLPGPCIRSSHPPLFADGA